MVNKKVADAIRKHALKNAIDYGKANPNAVLGRILSVFPETKGDIEGLVKEIAKIVKDVNALPKRELEQEFEKYREGFEKIQETKAKQSVPKFVLEGAVKGKFATRYAPAPSGYMHIGHAKAAFMARELADVYDGEIFLYFDDTNP